MKFKQLTFILIGILLLFSCNQTTQNGGNEATESNSIENISNQADPAWVVNQIFKAAKNSEYEILLKLCDPKGEGDSDTRNICSTYISPIEARDQFNTYFKFGQIIGKPVIVEDQAKVQIKFGPNGDKDETMNLVNRDGKWYLSSF